jgi:hypothetical protein
MRSIDPSRSACGIVRADFGPGGENGIPALLLVVVLWNTLETASSRTTSIEPAKLSTKELPAEDDVVTAPDLDHDDWDPDNWNPEEATWMIEASLRENNINARRDPLEDGSRKFSSCLTMKGAQREIVHEIKEATVTLR